MNVQWGWNGDRRWFVFVFEHLKSIEGLEAKLYLNKKKKKHLKHNRVNIENAKQSSSKPLVLWTVYGSDMIEYSDEGVGIKSRESLDRRICLSANVRMVLSVP